MRKTIAALVAALAAASALTATPAGAEAQYSPSLYAPVQPSPSGETVIQVNAGPGTWGIRRSARRLGTQLEGVTVRTAGDCATADACVRVEARRFSAPEQFALIGQQLRWTGLTTYPSAGERVVYLNTAARLSREYRAHVAAHELGHVLGLAHQEAPGLMSDHWHRADDDLLSPGEVAVLDAWYSPAQ